MQVDRSKEAIALARRLIPLLDLTSLDEDDTPEKIAALCQRAVTPFGPVAAVCIHPRFVKQAKELLNGTGVRAAALVNYPDAMSSPREVTEIISAAVADGADEIELLAGWGRYWSDQRPKMAALTVIWAAREACGNRPLKIAIELGSLEDQVATVKASTFSMSSADFLKLPQRECADAATLEQAETMLRTIRAHLGHAHAANGPLPRVDPNATDREQSEVMLEMAKRSSPFRPNHPVGFVAGGVFQSVAEVQPFVNLAERTMGKSFVDSNTLRIGCSGALLDDIIAAAARQTAVESTNDTKGAMVRDAGFYAAVKSAFHWIRGESAHGR